MQSPEATKNRTGRDGRRYGCAVGLISSGGGFSFLPTDGPFSDGVVAEPGHAIVRARVPMHLSLTDGYRLVERVLGDAGRPLSALCAMELRIPRPLTRSGFDDFNLAYIGQMRSWNVLVDGHVPAARTNVAPELDPPSEPSLHAFCFTVRSPSSASSERRTFVVSGVAERAGMAGEAPEIWADVVDTLERRMGGLGARWSDVTEMQLYVPRSDHRVFAAASLARLTELSRPGIRWFLSRPPIDDLRMEIDVRALADDRAV